MDNNLKLLALGELYCQDAEIKDLIDAIDAQNLEKLVFEDNAKYDWFDRIVEVEDQLLAIEISDQQFKKINLLSGECCHTFSLVMPNWDGEGDEFNIKSFAGIEKMVNLTCIEFLDFSYSNDIERLLDLNLKEIDEFSGLSDIQISRFSNQGIMMS
ncbi:MAG: hypothetical protein HWE24_05535 [Oceanospirillaceae bacterium]|nr:hypothetical protein [Oceanospirillaceae bacterium]